MKVIVLAGGSGTRLWPISRTSYPKQFLHFGQSDSLLQKTLRRFFPALPAQNILILTNHNYRHLVEKQAAEVDLALKGQVVTEPCRKNTAPAIALGMKWFTGDEPVLICSSDHLISPPDAFLRAVEGGLEHAVGGEVVVFGVRPTRPETGYGYILANGNKVEQFVEKPDLKRAQEYLIKGNYFWNAGIFLLTPSVFWEEMALFCPEIGSLRDLSLKEVEERFASLPDISIDYALMEKTRRAAVIPLDLTWTDIGSWDSVYEAFDKDAERNVKTGNVHTMRTKDCLIYGGKRLISTIGLEDLLVVDTDDALFVAKKGESQFVKGLIDELKKKGTPELEEHKEVKRPWGAYTVLEEGERFKIKRISVEPGQRLSLQFHYHRSEHWVVVKGMAKVTVGDQESFVHENESLYVPKGATHRLENPGKVRLEMIEVQVGEYVGEDDIVRLEDIYGRVK